jgi:hypothetical protein
MNRPERWCKGNLFILENSSSTRGKIDESEYCEFSSEMKRTTDLDLNPFQLRNLIPKILIGRASGRNAGWVGWIGGEIGKGKEAGHE